MSCCTNGCTNARGCLLDRLEPRPPRPAPPINATQSALLWILISVAGIVLFAIVSGLAGYLHQHHDTVSSSFWAAAARLSQLQTSLLLSTN